MYGEHAVVIDYALHHCWIFLAIGVGLLFSAIHGLVTRRSSVFVTGEFERSEHPLLYWSSIVMLSAAGLAGILIFVFRNLRW